MSLPQTNPHSIWDLSRIISSQYGEQFDSSYQSKVASDTNKPSIIDMTIIFLDRRADSSSVANRHDCIENIGMIGLPTYLPRYPRLGAKEWISSS